MSRCRILKKQGVRFIPWRRIYDTSRKFDFPATLHLESMILGVESRKIWFAHHMLVNARECATGEFMSLHFDTREGGGSPMHKSMGV